MGEALVDLVAAEGDAYRAKPGGSPYNVAIGLARLGQTVELCARAGADAFGELLYAHAAASGVGLASWTWAPEPTSVAVATLDASGRADYSFYLSSTAALGFDAADLRAVAPATDVLHVGSLASVLSPSRERIREVQTAAFEGGASLVSYDPNVRPALIEKTADAVQIVEASVSLAHVVKASDADTDWLYPDDSLAEIGSRWLALGATLVVITRGPVGACVFTRTQPPIVRPAPSVIVADTVGAGDAFTAGLLAALAEKGWRDPQGLEAATRDAPEALSGVIDRALQVASLACERPGADPPSGADVVHRFGRCDSNGARL